MSALQVGQGFMTLRSLMVRPEGTALSGPAPAACEQCHGMLKDGRRTHLMEWVSQDSLHEQLPREQLQAQW